MAWWVWPVVNSDLCTLAEVSGETIEVVPVTQSSYMQVCATVSFANVFSRFFSG